jgi:hypothetical protein
MKRSNIERRKLKRRRMRKRKSIRMRRSIWMRMMAKNLGGLARMRW